MATPSLSVAWVTNPEVIPHCLSHAWYILPSAHQGCSTLCYTQNPTALSKSTATILDQIITIAHVGYHHNHPLVSHPCFLLRTPQRLERSRSSQNPSQIISFLCSKPSNSLAPSDLLFLSYGSLLFLELSGTLLSQGLPTCCAWNTLLSEYAHDWHSSSICSKVAA